ncbi:MAG: type II toxin-antitoxin system HicA family toxin [Candidatus Brocadiaceae bacterium]|nr:type II toxin-antitoxin system HicA family toxin [Candidatus Brocadiaceae bacterium]
MKKKKLLQRLLSEPRYISFSDVVECANVFGFRLDRIKGSHHIYAHPDVKELIAFQDVRGQAKPYQLKRLFNIIERYNLKMIGGKV